MKSFFLMLAFAAIFQLSCAEIPKRSSKTTTKNSHKPNILIAHTGYASWYGNNFHGKKTASGESYNQNDMTAAHKKLPFGTRVLVKNLTNGTSAIVRINDRGPFARGRIIDVSFAAAKVLGIVKKGIAKVTLKVLGN